MIVTVTERGQFKRCRWMWDHESLNRQAITPINPRPAFAIGRMIHQGLEHWIMQPEADPLKLFDKHAAHVIHEIENTYKAKVKVAISDSELEPIYDGMALGRDMISNYATHYKRPLPEGFVFKQPEQTCIVPIPGTPHFLKGTLDGLLQAKDGTWYILEHKTYGQRPRAESLDENDQFIAYIWLATQLNIGPVGGVLYDGLWKRAEPPRGRKFDDLFYRTLLQRPAVELHQFEAELGLEVTDMANSPLIYKNRVWQGCFDCDIRRLCVTHSRGEDYLYALRTYFTKRTDDSVMEDDADD